MKKLEEQLRANLLKDSAIEIKKSDMWHLPVITYSVTYTRVKRSQMDILMKMMLLTFEQTEIRRAANLSELLLVEELFISDLLEKMQRMGLVRQEEGSYRLTSKGQNQLQTGILVEEMDEESTDMNYSPFHDECWQDVTDPESLPTPNEDFPLFRYSTNQNSVSTDTMLRVLSERNNGMEEEGLQTEVSEIKSFEEQKIEHVPYLEFQLYNKEKDIFYVRVWNTWLGRWDEALEKRIEEKERLEWREKWMEVEEGS